MAIPRRERQTTSEVCQLFQNVAYSRCSQSLRLNRSCPLLILSAAMNSKPWLGISCAQIGSLQVPYPFLCIPVHTGIQSVFCQWFFCHGFGNWGWNQEHRTFEILIQINSASTVQNPKSPGYVNHAGRKQSVTWTEVIQVQHYFVTWHWVMIILTAYLILFMMYRNGFQSFTAV